MVNIESKRDGDGGSEIIIKGTESELNEFFIRASRVMDSGEIRKAGGSVSMMINGQTIQIVAIEESTNDFLKMKWWQRIFRPGVPSRDVIIAGSIMFACIVLVGIALLSNKKGHKTAQQVDSAEASTIAVPPSMPSGSPR